MSKGRILVVEDDFDISSNTLAFILVGKAMMYRWPREVETRWP